MTDNINEAILNAKTKLLLKQGGTALAAIILGALAAIVMKSFLMAVIPFVFALLPIGLIVYHQLLYKNGLVGWVIATNVSTKRDVVGGIVSGMSLSKKRYTFAYTDEEGKEQEFFISRSGRFTDIRQGEKYLVLYDRRRKLASDNFMEYTPVTQDILEEKNEKA